jgi:glycosyltransferase involved in cell wall biosynthesis
MLCKAAEEFEPDLIYERHALHCEAGVRAAQKMAVPLFLEVNSPMVGEMEKLGLLTFPKRARRSEQRILDRADRIFVVTRVLGEILVDAGADSAKIVVTPNGADLEAFEGSEEAGREFRRKIGIPEKAFVLGFVGFPRAWHRLDLVLDAWKRLGDLAGDSYLLIVGDGPAVGPLLEKAKEMGFEQRIVVTGPLPRTSLKGPVGAFDLALIPAINSYASPLKLLDSLAAGVPTLVPDQPNLHEHVEPGEHALFFDPNSTDSFWQTLRGALEDVDALKSLGTQGRQHLIDSGMTWEANAKRVCKEWNKMGGGR